MRIQTIFRFKLGIRRVRGKEWASERVGRENMSHHENLIDLMRTALKSSSRYHLSLQRKMSAIVTNFQQLSSLMCHQNRKIRYFRVKIFDPSNRFF